MINELYAIFQKLYPLDKLSFSQFKLMKPWNLKNAYRETCLCRLCELFSLFIAGLHKVAEVLEPLIALAEDEDPDSDHDEPEAATVPEPDAVLPGSAPVAAAPATAAPAATAAAPAAARAAAAAAAAAPTAAAATSTLPSAAACPACAGKHRPHTCGSGSGGGGGGGGSSGGGEGDGAPPYKRPRGRAPLGMVRNPAHVT